MKVRLVLGLTFTLAVNFMSQPASGKAREYNRAEMQNGSSLGVTLIAQKTRYRRNDQLKFAVMLTNSGKDAVYIFGELGWGISASFDLRVHDASGKEVQPVGRFDDLTFVSPKDKNNFVKLLPDHFLGTNFFAPLEVLNLTKPGKYDVFIEYHSPFAAIDVQLDPFWGKEKGTLRSNVVEVEILR